MIRVALLFSLVLMTGCSSPRPTPRPDLNGLLRQSVNSRRDPSLGGRWLASLGQRNGRERVELIDLRSRSPVPLTGLNRADAQPISWGTETIDPSLRRRSCTVGRPPRSLTTASHSPLPLRAGALSLIHI